LCQERKVRAISEANLKHVIVCLHVHQVGRPTSMLDRLPRHPPEQRLAEQPLGVLQLLANRT
jgi:hypothetical protein